MHKVRIGKYGDRNLADRAPEPGSKHDQSGFVRGAWGKDVWEQQSYTEVCPGTIQTE